MENKFNEIYNEDVSKFTEKKKTGKDQLTYLSWAHAWRLFMKYYPDAVYEIVKTDNGLPYFADSSGAIVYTRVTAAGITHEMWLPVMDGANNAMKNVPYTYQVKEYNYGKPTGKMIDKTVESYTMFDINKTLMRCLTKNLAMFGLGLYIYAGEDLPNADDDKTSDNQSTQPEKQPTPPKDVKLTHPKVDTQELFYLKKTSLSQEKIEKAEKVLQSGSNAELNGLHTYLLSL